MTNNRTLVLYHANCWDGFCAAWAFHRADPDAEFVPMQYGDTPPDVTGRDVYVLDFSFKRDVLLTMKAAARSLLVLDHHKTAEAELAGLDFCTFDMNKSGGRLTWEFLAEHGNVHPIAPWLVDYTEDRDLWRWSLPKSKEINSALRTYSLDFDVWDCLHSDPATRDRLIDEGMAILRAEQAIIESHVKNAHETTIDGHKVLCVNATTLISEIAGELAKDRPFGVCWFEGDNNERVYSLRSRDGGIDVSEIAKAHGGGGHRNAAGFRVPATGATGVFSQGQATPDDEGDIKIAVAADRAAGIVRIEFGKPTAWIGLPAKQAHELAGMLAVKAAQL
jgi:uncharacterized protein